MDEVVVLMGWREGLGFWQRCWYRRCGGWMCRVGCCCKLGLFGVGWLMFAWSKTRGGDGQDDFERIVVVRDLYTCRISR